MIRCLANIKNQNRLLMRNLAFIVVAIAVLASCQNKPEGEQAKTGQEQEVKKAAAEADPFTVDTQNSVVNWLGTKPGGEHYGTVQLKSGQLQVKEGMIQGGNFVLDMASIKSLDIEDENMNAKLVGHLKSPDFFNVESYPEASFKITDVKAIKDAAQTAKGLQPTHEISGNLTVKDITKNISFPAQVSVTDGTIEAKTPQFLINRTDWEVNYKSKSVFNDLKDNFIGDDMGIRISLTATK